MPKKSIPMDYTEEEIAGRVGVGRPAWSSRAGRAARPKFGAQRSSIAALGDSTRVDNDREGRVVGQLWRTNFSLAP
jgi:hypothetical protein